MPESYNLEQGFEKLRTALEKAINFPIWLNEIGTNYAEFSKKRMVELVAVDTGALRDSIEIVPLKDKLEISMLFYGLFVDEGTRYMRAQPFITEALDYDYAEDILNAIKAELDKNI